MTQQQKADFQKQNRKRFAIIDGYTRRIYLLYPLQAQEPASLQAIKRALVEEEGRGHLHADGPLHAAFLFIRTKTEAYSAARSGDLLTFPAVPFAGYWFRNRCYRDDPTTWIKGNAKPRINAPDYSKGFFDGE